MLSLGIPLFAHWIAQRLLSINAGETFMPAVQELPPLTLDASAVLSALQDLKRGNFSVRLPIDWTGVPGKVADAFNDVVELNERMAREFDRLSRVVGKEGKIAQRASLGNVT